MRTISAEIAAAEIAAADNTNAAGGNDDTCNGELETAIDAMNENINVVGHRDFDFSEGLSRFFSGMCVNMSKAVYSTAMAYLTVSNEG